MLTLIPYIATFASIHSKTIECKEDLPTVVHSYNYNNNILNSVFFSNYILISFNV